MVTSERRLDRRLDGIARAALGGGSQQPHESVAAALCQAVEAGLLGEDTARPYATEVLRRVGAAYARAVARTAEDGRGPSQGVHYTPGPLADRLAELVAEVVPGSGVTLDPACGAGSLLLAWRDRYPSAAVAGWDVDGAALGLARLLLAVQARQRGLEPATELHVADLFEAEPGDVAAVLINPPYGTRLGTSAQDFARRARLGPREHDLFALALERVRGWSAVRAVGAIVPDAIRMQPELAGLRRGLAAEGWLRRVEPMPFGTFPRATVRPCLLLGATPVQTAGREGLGPVVVRSGRGRTTEQPVAGEDDLDRWPAEDRRARELWEQCAGGARTLGELCHCHEGVHTGNIRHKLLTADGGESDARPLLKGADVRRYRLEFRQRFIRYDRGHVDRAAGEYASLRDPDVFRGPKLLSRQTSDHLVVCLDAGDTVTDNSLHTLRVRQAEQVSVEWLALLLNSSLATALYRSQSEERDRPLPQIKLALLRRLPVRAAAESVGRVQALYRQAVAEAGCGGLGAATEAAIDALVFDSYGVPGSDRDWIRRDLGAARTSGRRAAEDE